jgi:hypothetical protein
MEIDYAWLFLRKLEGYAGKHENYVDDCIRLFFDGNADEFHASYNRYLDGGMGISG